jgi:hypothetical protein
VAAFGTPTKNALSVSSTQPLKFGSVFDRNGALIWQADKKLQYNPQMQAGGNPLATLIAAAITAAIFVRHKVNDYAKWRKAYDGFESTRIKLGAKGHAVYRDVDDGNDVTAWHDFDNLEAAKAFSSSNELKAAMKGAGVIGAPTIWITRHTRSRCKGALGK